MGDPKSRSQSKREWRGEIPLRPYVLGPRFCHKGRRRHSISGDLKYLINRGPRLRRVRDITPSMARMLLAIRSSSRRLRSKNWRRSPLMRTYSGFLRFHINGGTRLRKPESTIARETYPDLNARSGVFDARFITATVIILSFILWRAVRWEFRKSKSKIQRRSNERAGEPNGEENVRSTTTESEATHLRCRSASRPMGSARPNWPSCDKQGAAAGR